MAKPTQGTGTPRRGAQSGARGFRAGGLSGPGRPIALLLAILALFGAAWYVAWQSVRSRVFSSDAYWLDAQHIEITPLPDWIHTDLCSQVFRDASLDRPLSITEADVIERIRSAFAMHPWVAKVERVQKFHPARVRVDLVYRRPVCMVDLAGELIPVDAEGVVLPSADFTPVEASRYMRLVGIDSRPLGPAGTRWGDPRVVGGAEIAAALGDLAEQTRPVQIVAAASPPAAGLREAALFELLARDGTRIRWGWAPSRHAPGEPAAASKVARLKQYLAEHGCLEGQPGQTILDLGRLETPESPGPATPWVPLR